MVAKRRNDFPLREQWSTEKKQKKKGKKGKTNQNAKAEA